MISKLISSFASALNKGRKSALGAMISGGEPVISTTASQIMSSLSNAPGPLTQPQPNSFTVSSYNTLLTTVLADLGSLYAESYNLWSILLSIKNLASTQNESLLSSVSSLENATGLSYSGASSSIGNYTDTLIQNITSATPMESALSFYGNGTIPKSYIDPKDNLMKLPVMGEFTVDLSVPGITPSYVFLDRVAGRPVSQGNPCGLAFDGRTDTFWNETIQSDSPIYCTQNLFPWIPISPYSSLGYQGGAACRLKIELERLTQISELDIRPYGKDPMNLIGIGYTDESLNSLADPTFSTGVAVDPNSPSPGYAPSISSWWVDTSANGTIGLGNGWVEIGAGPNGENAVYLETYVSSGATALRQNNIPITTAGSLELSMLIKTAYDTPILASVSFVTSGSVTIVTREQLIYPESLGWTNVVTTFDSPPAATSVNIKIGIPAYFKSASSMEVCSIFLEPVKQQPRYDSIVNRTTVYLGASIMAKRLYLSFSQENASFVTYSVPIPVNWGRLERHVPFPIIDWSSPMNRLGSPSMIRSANINGPLAETLTQIPGSSWSLVQGMEELANPPSAPSVSAYEYNMGAYEITIRHREYGSTSRYVSPPLNIPGEIREITISAEDSVVEGVTSPGSIRYEVTMFPNDPPEKGIALVNSALGGQTILGNANSAPPSIPYLNPLVWTAGATGFMAIPWPSQIPFSISSAYLLIQMGATESRQISTVYVQNNMSSPINLDGALSIVGSYSIFTNQMSRMVMGPVTFTVQFSPDGVNWNIGTSITDTMSYFDWSMTSLPSKSFSIDLSSISQTELQSIQYMRISTSWGRGIPAYIALGNLQAEMISVSSFTSVNIYPSDNIPSAYLPGQSFIAPVRGITDDINGTDRYGRAYLSSYPYFNSTTMLSLIQTLSSNLNGQTAPYDPNALNPPYIFNNGSIGYATGYRPITVSLYFSNSGLTVQPDILGKPKPMDMAQSVYELLSPASLTQSSSSSLQTLNLVQAATSDSSSSVINTPSSQSLATVRNLTLWQTQYQNIAAGPKGVNIKAWWSNGSPTGDIAINPMLINVNPSLGTVQILQPPPSGYSQVRATYSYVITETSPRENFYGTASPSGVSLGLVPQNYPVTRNMTDYVNGTVPVLTPSNLDPLSPDYYPVFEYYFDPSGFLMFADNLFEYGNQPAIITVDYQTLDINPRVSIEMFGNSNDTSETPYVRNYTLNMNIRRG